LGEKLDFVFSIFGTSEYPFFRDLAAALHTLIMLRLSDDNGTRYPALPILVGFRVPAHLRA
jgi:hypothetical protein